MNFRARLAHPILLSIIVSTAWVGADAPAFAAAVERTYVLPVAAAVNPYSLQSFVPLGISADGRYITFSSSSAGGRYDRLTGQVVTPPLAYGLGDLSADGRYSQSQGRRIDLVTGSGYTAPFTGNPNGTSGIGPAISDDGNAFLVNTVENSTPHGWLIDTAANTATALGSTVNSISADGLHVAFTKQLPCAGGSTCYQNWVLDRTTGRVALVAETGGYTTLSGDGSMAVYVEVVGGPTGVLRLSVWNSATGLSHALSDEVSGIPAGAVVAGLSDDGTRVLVRVNDGTLLLADRADRTLTLIGRSTEATALLSGDGNSITYQAFATSPFDRRLVVTEVAGPRSAHLAAGETLELQVGGRADVPVDASAAVLNVTATNTGAAGFVTVWPCGSERPLASNVNFSAAGQTTPNAVIASLSPTGTACFFSNTKVDLVVDVNGAFPVGAAYNGLVPDRLLDTRDGQTDTTANLPAGRVTELQVGGRSGVPIDASAAVLNVTATNTSGPGFVTVWPCGAERPLASSVNFPAAGVTTPNAVIARLSPTGTVCFFSNAAVDLVVDVNGALPASAVFVGLVPDRLLDTRNGELDASPNLPAGKVTELQVGGRSGVPGSAAATVLNVTATNTGGPGFVTVWPCGTDRPLASNVNFSEAGVTTPNAVIARLGATGTVCFFSNAAIDLVVDVGGAFPASATYIGLVPDRLMDTRQFN